MHKCAYACVSVRVYACSCSRASTCVSAHAYIYACVLRGMQEIFIVIKNAIASRKYLSRKPSNVKKI